MQRRGEMRECGVKGKHMFHVPCRLDYWQVFVEASYLHLGVALLVVISELSWINVSVNLERPDEQLISPVAGQN